MMRRIIARPLSTEPLFALLQQKAGIAPAVARETQTASMLLDRLGLYTTELYQKGREELIRRQQEELLELSTPVIRLWDGILALPLIGTLDSARTQTVMESLLEQIVTSGAEIAIIDITGVPTVEVAQDLRQLAFILQQRRDVRRIFKDQRYHIADQQRAQHSGAQRAG
jgi:hypothetical protein